MTDQTEARQRIVDENYDAFMHMLPELMKEHAGQFVVMREKKAIEFFDSARDAAIYAMKLFPDKLFSIQEITQRAVDLGWFSHAPVYNSIRSC